MCDEPRTSAFGVAVFPAKLVGPPFCLLLEVRYSHRIHITISVKVSMAISYPVYSGKHLKFSLPFICQIFSRSTEKSLLVVVAETLFGCQRHIAWENPILILHTPCIKTPLLIKPVGF